MILRRRSVRSSLVKILCSTEGGRPRSRGMIHIWMNRMGSVSEAFCSECHAPDPRVIRCADPAGSSWYSPPRLSACRNVPSTTYVSPSMSRCGCIGQSAPGTSRSSLNTRRDPNRVQSGSRYRSKEKCHRAWNQPPSVSKISRFRLMVITSTSFWLAGSPGRISVAVRAFDRLPASAQARVRLLRRDVRAGLPPDDGQGPVSRHPDPRQVCPLDGDGTVAHAFVRPGQLLECGPSFRERPANVPHVFRRRGRLGLDHPPTLEGEERLRVPPAHDLGGEAAPADQPAEGRKLREGASDGFDACPARKPPGRPVGSLAVPMDQPQDHPGHRQENHRTDGALQPAGVAGVDLSAQPDPGPAEPGGDALEGRPEIEM